MLARRKIGGINGELLPEGQDAICRAIFPCPNLACAEKKRLAANGQPLDLSAKRFAYSALP